MNARTARAVLVVALALGFCLVANKAHAQAYKYKDEAGHVHFTENYYEVPEKYRKKLETREMPVVVDKNSPNAHPAGASEVAFEDGVRSVSGKDLTIKQQESLAAWWKAWGTTWIIVGGISLVLQLAIHFGLIVHALTNSHVGWGIANFLVGVTTPIYLMVHLEQSMVTRVGLLLLYFAPGIALGIAFRQILAVLA
ncbi:MAG TPA: DUF4124 domain-containing protein [Myxococcota bacterium]|nr:DUF4124 domain-containing protein [Myxococcota bacterium]